MAQQLQNITISAPAFKGLNTQDSPITGDPSFAAVADNCVIDTFGRIGARKGFNTLTTDATELGSSSIASMGYFEDDGGNTKVFSAGNNKILSGIVTLTDETPASYTITSDNWKMVNFNDSMYFFQRGYEPLVYTHADGMVKMSDATFASGTPPEAHECLAAYGRLWCADFSTDKQTVQWSDLLNGTAWSGGTSGQINLSKVWPDGHDEIVALSAHNGFLIIFGKNSTVVYAGAEDPATMVLQDTFAGLGCIARDSVQHTGNDIFFLSHAGLRSFGRLIQDKSFPNKDISKNIRNDFIGLVNVNATDQIKSIYSPENAFYLITLGSVNITFCFDMRGSLEDGSHRVTRWPSTPFKAMVRTESGTLYVGNDVGVGTYENYKDNDELYVLRYYSNPLVFGDSSRTKILKKVIPTVITEGGINVSVKWGYDFSDSFSSSFIPVPSLTGAQYGEAEYGISEYAASSGNILKKAVNTTGNGSVVTVGLEADIDGQRFSLQELNIQALIGRTI